MSEPSDQTRQAAWAAVTVAAVMVGQQVAGRAIRDGFFLSNFDASTLPSVMTGASILSVVIVLGSARLFRRVPPSRSLPFFFWGNAALFLVEWALSAPMPRLSAVMLYLHITSIGAVVVSGFWSVVNERFDPHTAKQLIGRIGTGATAGGALGGLAAWAGASAFDIPTMILVLAGLNALCVILVRRIGGPVGAEPEPVEARISAFEILQETPYLRHLALLVALAAFAGAAFDYVFKARAADYFTTGAELVSFFALFYLGLGVATLVVQTLLVRRSLLALGLAVTVGILPGALVGLGLLALLAPGIVATVAMRSGISVVENSLYRSGYELLYTPLIPEKKRPTKTLVDVGGDKLGAAVGGGVAFFVLGIFPGAANPILLGVGIAAGAAALFVTRRLHQGYVLSLAESLRTGSIKASQVEALDATTQQTVSDTVVDMERAELLESVQLAATGPSATELSRAELLELREAAPQASSRRGRPFSAPRRRAFDAAEIDDTLAAILDLRSGDRARIEETLASNNPLPGAVVAHVIPLLEKEEGAESVAAALRKVAPAHTGVLLDAVLSSRPALPIRRRVCEILGRLPTQRCANGLVLLLEDEEFELRFRAASGLLQIHRSNSKLRVPAEKLFEAAEREARECSRRWRYLTAVDNQLTQTARLDSAQGRRVIQSVAYIFTLLLTVLDREPLQLAIRALATQDGGHRGTGLEYLDNVLPRTLRDPLWPLLEDRRLALGTVRDRSEILGELVEESPPRAIDLAALRERIDARRRVQQPPR